jgi:MFS family permease
VLAGAAVVGLSGLLLAGLGTLAGAAAALIVFGLGQSILFAGAVPWLDESFGELDRGLAYGGLNLVFAIGYTTGPLVGGWLLETSGADVVYLLMTGVAGAGAIALALTSRRISGTKP